MRAREIMTRDPACCTPNDTIQHAATLMIANDCGCIPVVGDLQTKTIVGLITDRDIACRCVAEGKASDTRVGDVMSSSPSCCGPDDDVRDVERVMADRKVRRVPIVEGDCCVGMVSQADLAIAEDRGLPESEVGRLVEIISEPG